MLLQICTTQSIQKSPFSNYWNKLSSNSNNKNVLQVVATRAYYPPVATTLSILRSEQRYQSLRTTKTNVSLVCLDPNSEHVNTNIFGNCMTKLTILCLRLVEACLILSSSYLTTGTLCSVGDGTVPQNTAVGAQFRLFSSRFFDTQRFCQVRLGYTVLQQGSRSTISFSSRFLDIQRFCSGQVGHLTDPCDSHFRWNSKR